MIFLGASLSVKPRVEISLAGNKHRQKIAKPWKVVSP
jgi:hypothetical protein